MTTNAFLQQLRSQPESISFADTMAVVDANYQFTETAFSNGDQHNAAGENNGSCKLFAFAQLQQLSQAETLHCFGDYYRKDVLANPTGDDHQNVRNFIRLGWAGIRFSATALAER